MVTRVIMKLGIHGLGILLLILSCNTSQLRSQDEVGLLLEKTRQYEARLQTLLASLERKRDQERQKLATYQELYAEGLVARVKLEAQTAEVERQQKAVQAEQQHLEVSRQLRLEILASLHHPDTPAEVEVERFPGNRKWTLEDLPSLSLYYQDRFGEALPISAEGQTAVHTQLGFDHRQGADLAVHPDSDAGKAILLYLKQEGIPFIAFRAAVKGAATGAHIHVGRPSNRLHGQ